MYRIPGKHTGHRTVLNCTQSCFYQYANHLPFLFLSIKLKYPGFFYHFSICFVSFYIVYYFCESWILSCEELRGNVFTTTAIHICCASVTHICKLAFIRQIECCLWFPRCLPFWAPYFFDYQDFLSFTSDFLKLWEMLYFSGIGCSSIVSKTIKMFHQFPPINNTFRRYLIDRKICIY